MPALTIKIRFIHGDAPNRMPWLRFTGKMTFLAWFSPESGSGQ
jgi:hypothetical protein